MPEPHLHLTPLQLNLHSHPTSSSDPIAIKSITFHKSASFSPTSSPLQLKSSFSPLAAENEFCKNATSFWSLASSSLAEITVSRAVLSSPSTSCSTKSTSIFLGTGIFLKARSFNKVDFSTSLDQWQLQEYFLGWSLRRILMIKDFFFFFFEWVFVE